MPLRQCSSLLRNRTESFPNRLQNQPFVSTLRQMPSSFLLHPSSSIYNKIIQAFRSWESCMWYLLILEFLKSARDENWRCENFLFLWECMRCLKRKIVSITIRLLCESFFQLHTQVCFIFNELNIVSFNCYIAWYSYDNLSLI